MNKKLVDRDMPNPYLTLVNIVFIASLFLSGCATRPELVELPAEEEFQRAQGYLENRQYDRAIQGFERVIFYHPSSEFVDDAQYWLARTYFAKNDFAQSVIEFDYLIKNFSASPFIEEANFYRAKSYVKQAPGWDRDQTEINEAIDYLDEFLTRYPNSKYTNEVKELILSARDRLARKELENGKLYMKLKEPGAAVKYFLFVIENYPETKSEAEAKYNLAGIYRQQHRTDEALALYRELLDKTEWKTRVEKKIRELENKK
jgi:outer membrane protein assembly factor BamD